MAYFLDNIIGDGLAPRMEVLDDDRKQERLAFSRQHDGRGMMGGVRFPPEIVPRRFQTEGKRPPGTAFSPAWSPRPSMTALLRRLRR